MKFGHGLEGLFCGGAWSRSWSRSRSRCLWEDIQTSVVEGLHGLVRSWGGGSRFLTVLFGGMRRLGVLFLGWAKSHTLRAGCGEYG